MKFAADSEQRAARAGNLASRIRWRNRALRLLGAFLLGAVLAGAYAPFEWSWLAWLALAPLLGLGLRYRWRAWVLGYCFGCGYFILGYAWLGEVYIVAPISLGLAHAFFPAIWLGWGVAAYEYLGQPESRDLQPRTDPRFTLNFHVGPGRQCLWLLWLAALWCSLEWVRSWFLSGLPWNQLGVSQWRVGWLLPICRFTGVYGISFLVVAVNVGLYLLWRNWPQCRETPARERVPWPLLMALLLFQPAILSRFAYSLPPARASLRVAACQGNIPQIRVYRTEELRQALNVYLDLSRQAVASQPDLLVWPETAVPAPLTWCMAQLPEEFARLQTPLLAGSVETREAGPPDAPVTLTRDYNSALLIDRDSKVIDFYDKIRIVPFGEFVPFERYLPWVVDYIGMGRGLTPGREFTVFNVAKGARLGVNICYEDVFPEISRGFVRRGANVLVTITNDAWYNQSGGSRQHMAHSVFRAVENLRPMLRSGNNSDTCLILPDGRVTGRLVSPATGSPFHRGVRLYEVPVRDGAAVTFYTRYGDLFAHLCVALTALGGAWLLYRFFSRKQRLCDMMKQTHVPDA